MGDSCEKDKKLFNIFARYKRLHVLYCIKFNKYLDIWWDEHCFVASQTLRFQGNVKYKTKMTTLYDRTTVQINARTFGTETYTNKQYNNTFRHANSNQAYTVIHQTRVSST